MKWNDDFWGVKKNLTKDGLGDIKPQSKKSRVFFTCYLVGGRGPGFKKVGKYSAYTPMEACKKMIIEQFKIDDDELRELEREGHNLLGGYWEVIDETPTSIAIGINEESVVGAALTKEQAIEMALKAWGF